MAIGFPVWGACYARATTVSTFLRALLTLFWQPVLHQWVHWPLTSRGHRTVSQHHQGSLGLCADPAQRPVISMVAGRSRAGTPGRGSNLRTNQKRSLQSPEWWPLRWTIGARRREGWWAVDWPLHRFSWRFWQLSSHRMDHARRAAGCSQRAWGGGVLLVTTAVLAAGQQLLWLCPLGTQCIHLKFACAPFQPSSPPYLQRQYEKAQSVPCIKPAVLKESQVLPAPSLPSCKGARRLCSVSQMKSSQKLLQATMLLTSAFFTIPAYWVLIALIFPYLALY